MKKQANDHKKFRGGIRADIKKQMAYILIETTTLKKTQ